MGWFEILKEERMYRRDAFGNQDRSLGLAHSSTQKPADVEARERNPNWKDSSERLEAFSEPLEVIGDWYNEAYDGIEAENRLEEVNMLNIKSKLQEEMLNMDKRRQLSEDKLRILEAELALFKPDSDEYSVKKSEIVQVKKDIETTREFHQKLVDTLNNPKYNLPN